MLAAEAVIDAKSCVETLPPWWNLTTTYAEEHKLPSQYWMASRCMSSWVEITRNWGLMVASRGNGVIVFRNSGLEESYPLGVPLFCFCSSFRFSILYYFIRSRPSMHRVGMGFTTSGSQSMGGGVSRWTGSTKSLPYCANRCRDFWVSMSTYVAWLFTAFISFLFLMYGIYSPGGLHLERG